MPSDQHFRSDGHGSLARIGVAISHGFTGSPLSMRAWSDSLAEQGFAVNMPLLAGHGTSWEDLSRTPWQHWYRDFEAAYLELANRCDAVFVAGLSMGGALALRVAALQPVAGVAVVNPGLTFADKRAPLAPVIKHLVKSFPSIGNDIKAPNVDEGAYDRTPTAAVHELSKLFKDTISLLPKITAPTIVFKSDEDHVVPLSSLEAIKAGIGSSSLEVVPLHNSFHVATMDNDAAQIFATSAQFFREHAHAI